MRHAEKFRRLFDVGCFYRCSQFTDKHFSSQYLSMPIFDRQYQAALSERLAMILRRRGCELYLNGTRAFSETQKRANESLKAVKSAAPQRERGTEMVNTLCGLELPAK